MPNDAYLMRSQDAPPQLDQRFVRSNGPHGVQPINFRKAMFRMQHFFPRVEIARVYTMHRQESPQLLDYFGAHWP